MHPRRWGRAVDGLNRTVFRGVAWLVPVMVLVGAGNALARYLGRFLGVNLSSNAYLELQWYLFAAVFLLGGAHVLRAGGHVRVDVLFRRLSPRARAAVDLAGALILLLPFCAASLALSLPAVESSWAIGESSPDPGGLPRYPVKTLVPAGFGLLFLQGLVFAARAFARLRRTADAAPAPSPAEPGAGT